MIILTAKISSVLLNFAHLYSFSKCALDNLHKFKCIYLNVECLSYAPNISLARCRWCHGYAQLSVPGDFIDSSDDASTYERLRVSSKISL